MYNLYKMCVSIKFGANNFMHKNILAYVRSMDTILAFKVLTDRAIVVEYVVRRFVYSTLQTRILHSVKVCYFAHFKF